MLTYALKSCLISSFKFLTENEINKIEKIVNNNNIKINVIKTREEFLEKIYEEIELREDSNIAIKNVTVNIIYRKGNIKVGKKIYKNGKLIKEEKTVINPNVQYVILRVINGGVNNKNKYELFIYE